MKKTLLLLLLLFTASSVWAYQTPAPEVHFELTDDPQMMGYWLVLIDRHGEEVWVKLWQNENGSWIYPVVLDYATYGGYRPGIDPVRRVPFFFVINGCAWGAPDDGSATVLGYPMSNPLCEGTYHYTVPVGYHYTLGVYQGWDDSYYVYSAQGAPLSGDPADYADVGGTMRGDADGDGEVTIADAVMLIDYIISHDATDINLNNADSDQDGEISIADVVATIDFILTQTW